MNRTIEDSKQFDVVCMSFGKEKQKGIEVVEAGEKDSFILQTMEIKAENCELLKNGNLKTEGGKNIINFADYAKVKNNNESRITEFALAKAKRKSQRDSEQVI